MSTYDEYRIEELINALPPKDAYDTDEDYKKDLEQNQKILQDLRNAIGTDSFNEKYESACLGFMEKYKKPETSEATSKTSTSPWNLKNMGHDLADGFHSITFNKFNKKQKEQVTQPEAEDAEADVEATTEPVASATPRYASKPAKDVPADFGTARIISNKLLGTNNLVDDTNSFTLQSAFQDYKDERKKADAKKTIKELLVVGAAAGLTAGAIVATVGGGAQILVLLAAGYGLATRYINRRNKRSKDFELNKKMLDKAAEDIGLSKYKVEEEKAEKKASPPIPKDNWSVYSEGIKEETPQAQAEGKEPAADKEGPDLSQPADVNKSQTMQVMIGEDLSDNLEKRKNNYLGQHAKNDAKKSKIGGLVGAVAAIGIPANLFGLICSKESHVGKVYPEFKQFFSDMASDPGHTFFNTINPTIVLGVMVLAAYGYQKYKNATAKSSHQKAAESLAGVELVQEQIGLLSNNQSPTVNPVDPLPPVRGRPRPSV